MNRRRKLALLLFGIAFALLLLVGAIIFVPQLTSPSPVARPSPTVVITHLTVADVSRLEKALNSPDLTVQATALVPDMAHIYLQQGKPMLPAGSTVSFLLNTEVCKNLSCKVNAALTEKSGKITTFVLYLDDGTGQWLIAGTNEVR